MKLTGILIAALTLSLQGTALKASPSDIVDVLAYGAKCTGIAFDDAPGINAALAAAGAGTAGRLVMLPPGGNCWIGSTLHVPAYVRLHGYGKSNAGDIRAKFTNVTMVSLDGKSSEIANLWINADAFPSNTAGVAIATAPSQFQIIHDVYITKAFVGMDLNGNTLSVDRVTVEDVAANGTGWSIGRLTTGASTADVRITNSTVGGNSTSGSFGQIIYDSGGLFEENDDLLFTTFGTYLIPGVNQQVIWTFISNSVVGDTNRVGGLVIDTAHPSARILGFQCNGCWAASQVDTTSGANILVNNGGGGVIDGLHFVGLRNYNSASHGAYFGAGTNISLTDSNFCGAAATKADIVIGNTVTNVSINGGHLGGACDGNAGGATIGVLLSGSNSNIQISNVNFNGVTTPVSGSLAGDSMAVGNYAMVPGAPTIASAATITLNGVYPTYSISGTIPISAIAGGWQNRQVTLITTSAVSFTASSSICKAYTSVANVPILATYSGACWYLK